MPQNINKLTFYKELNGIRAIAVIMIMIFHYFQFTNVTGNSFLNLFQKLTVFGQTGVTLFFVLSGFLITRILIFTKQDKYYFKNFYIRRSLRIFPLYYLYLIIVNIILPFFQKAKIVPFDQQIYYWVYLQNFATTFNWKISGPGHFWSLAVEEHFYLFWPLIPYFLNIKSLKKAIYIIIGLAFITRLLLLNNGYSVFFFTFTNMDCLAIGALLAISEYNSNYKLSFNKVHQYIFSISICLNILLFVLTSGKSLQFVQLVKAPLMSITYVFLIRYVIAISSKHIFKKILELNLMDFIGKISYGLYVFHPIILLSCLKYYDLLGSYGTFFTSFLTSFLVASLSYYLFESRFLQLKANFK